MQVWNLHRDAAQFEHDRYLSCTGEQDYGHVSYPLSEMWPDFKLDGQVPPLSASLPVIQPIPALSEGQATPKASNSRADYYRKRRAEAKAAKLASP